MFINTQGKTVTEYQTNLGAKGKLGWNVTQAE